MSRELNQLVTVVCVILTSILPVFQFLDIADVQCAQCFTTVSPDACQHWAKCGKGEKCFTREFVDHRGKQSFRLGCETTTVCDIFSSARFLIGKRYTDVHEMCYNCCNDHGCNSKLCLNAVSHPVTKASPLTTCPPTFSTLNGHCYYLATWLVPWATARADCNRAGAELVSINSKLEQDFLVQIIDKINATRQPEAIWTGGFWVPSTAQWNWLDNTAVNFTAWGVSKPSTPTNNPYIVMMKDPTHRTPGRWPWSNVAHSGPYWYICERSM